MKVRGFVAAGLACCLVTVGTSSAAAVSTHSQTAKYRNIRATVSYRGPTNSGIDPYRVRLEIARSSRRVLDQRVPPFKGGDGLTGNWPLGASGVNGRTVNILNLSGGSQPEILVDFFGGGAHCCFWTQIYYWDQHRHAYAREQHFWGNFGWRPQTLSASGRTELVTGDNRFAYAFASFAGSDPPIMILHFKHGRFVNATRSYPAAVGRDASKLWKWFKQDLRRHFEVQGVLAAWTADEALLGKSDAAFSWLRHHKREVLAGHLDAQSLRGYLSHLRAFLRKTGYLK